MPRPKLDEHEKRMRRIVGKLNGKPSFELLPHGSATCLTCKGPPTMMFSSSSKYWMAWCDQCDSNPQPITASTHLEAIAVWNTRNQRFK